MMETNIVKNENGNNQKVQDIIEIEEVTSSLDNFKIQYEEMRLDYGLPDFEKMNLDFNIEKIHVDETDILIREIRKYMGDKFSSYLKLIETLIQPSNAQMLIFIMLKSIGIEENKKLQEIYKKLAKKEIELVELDLQFNLDKEITFVNSSYELWQDIKIELLEIISKIKNGFGNDKEQNNERHYFG